MYHKSRRNVQVCTQCKIAYGLIGGGWGGGWGVLYAIHLRDQEEK